MGIVQLGGETHPIDRDASVQSIALTEQIKNRRQHIDDAGMADRSSVGRERLIVLGE